MADTSPLTEVLPPSGGGMSVRAERPADVPVVERIVAESFGPGRFAKTAERLREGGQVVAGFVACVDGHVVGTVRLWPVRVGDVAWLFLGPIAVDGGQRREGLGAALVAACLDHAGSSEVAGLLLVGDAPYFERFGFRVAPAVRLPGPVDPRRVLWWGPGEDAPEGQVRAA